MEVRVRPCCCSIHTCVTIIGILQSLVYLLLALGSSAWFALQSSHEAVETVVTEVNSMEEEEWVEELVRHTGTLRLTTRLLVVCLALAAAGLTTSLLLLLLGATTLQACTAVGGIGVGGCPRSCFATCSAAAFASTTSCTYTHISGIFLQTSTSTTKACNVCYPTGSAASTLTTSITSAITTLLGR